ncbi:hypothetical protein [Pilimelia columellifera]|uniref:Uncharacterized protein n=1 Tax=Pilimelia columellifera subsp. columellifera TaxID=706583 RepID=A0ABN3ND93_9ACTN
MTPFGLSLPNDSGLSVAALDHRQIDVSQVNVSGIGDRGVPAGVDVAAGVAVLQVVDAAGDCRRVTTGDTDAGVVVGAAVPTPAAVAVTAAAVAAVTAAAVAAVTAAAVAAVTAAAVAAPTNRLTFRRFTSPALATAKLSQELELARRPAMMLLRA